MTSRLFLGLLLFSFFIVFFQLLWFWGSFEIILKVWEFRVRKGIQCRDNLQKAMVLVILAHWHDYLVLSIIICYLKRTEFTLLQEIVRPSTIFSSSTLLTDVQINSFSQRLKVNILTWIEFLPWPSHRFEL